MLKKLLARLILGVLVICVAGACMGTAVEAATDTAIAVGNIPFKVGGAVVGVAAKDEQETNKEDQRQS